MRFDGSLTWFVARWLCLLLPLFACVQANAHSGGTNQYGCHNKTSDGTYHCHTGAYNGLSFANEQEFLDYIGSSTNQAPSVSVIGGNKIVTDSDGLAGETFLIVGLASDSDGSIASVVWKLGSTVLATGTYVNLTLTDGNHTITFEATDDDGATSSTSVLVTVAGPTASGIPPYNRDDYLPYWDDADGDCIDTRHEVLILESIVPVTMSSNGCSVVSGLWSDPFSGQSFTNPSDVDVDHLVALSEAHASGAYLWTSEQKKAFANDMLHADALRAIDDGTNSSKSNRDPAEWLPPNSSYHCEYVRDWVEIKDTYGLSYDDAEVAAIEAVLGADISSGERAKVTGIRQVTGDSDAVFKLGMTRNGGCGFTTSARVGDVVNISISITPEAAHLNQTASIYLVVSLGGNLYTISSVGALAPFTGQVSELVPFVAGHRFQQSYEFTLVNGVMDGAAAISVFVAYITEGGEMIYTPVPFGLEIFL